MPTKPTALLAAAALGATGLALASGPGAAAATDDTPGYSVQALTVDVKVGPANEQDCRSTPTSTCPTAPAPPARSRRSSPPTASAADKADSNQTAIGKGFVRQGYAVLSYSGLGFGKTTCKITLDDPDWDGKAGRQMVDVLAGKRPYLAEGSSAPQTLKVVSTESAGDPRVGMIGGSYGGQIQYAVAMQDPRIDAIIPIITWNDLTYSLAPGNVAKKQWIDLFFGAGIISGAQNASADPETMRVCPNFIDQACVGAVQLNTAGYPDAGHARAGQARLRRELRQAGQGTDAAGAGPEGHPVQPQRGRGDVPLAAGPGDPGEDGLAVVGPLRLRAGRRRARLRRRVAARLLPRQPVPELDGPLRQAV